MMVLALSSGSARQRRFIAWCQPGRGLETDSIDVFELKMKGESKPGGDESPPSGIGPWRGARVAPQHCPILRPDHDHAKQSGSSLQLSTNAGLQKEDISNELRMRTFLKSCDKKLFKA